MFADLKGRPDAKSFADELIDASARYHGVASREFLSKLVADVPGAIESVRRSRIAFNSANVADGVDGQVQRVGDRFALVAAAGELAIELGILPWPVGTAAEAAASCYQAWLGKRGDTGPAELAAGVTQIYKFIERDGMSRFQDILESSGTGVESTNRTVINRLGFRQQNKDKRWEYFVLPEQWVSEMCRGFDPKAIADEMIRLGVLIPDKKGGQRADVKKLPNQAGEMKVRRCYHLSADILVSPELLRENDSNKKRKFEK